MLEGLEFGEVYEKWNVNTVLEILVGAFEPRNSGQQNRCTDWVELLSCQSLRRLRTASFKEVRAAAPIEPFDVVAATHPD